MNTFRFISFPLQVVVLCAISAGAPALAASSACPGGSAGQMQVAGDVIYSQGVVEAQSAGYARPLAKGASVCVGETVVTSASGRVQIKMADGGLIGVRPGTKMRIDEFQFNGKEDGTERSAIALLEGGFRALTGQIGHTHKENYRITTPTAIIGIRGTDHEPVYIPAAVPGQAPAAEAGTYDKVHSGGVVITTSRGVVEVNPNQVGFAPDAPTAPPVILKEMPGFYHSESAAEETRGGSGLPREPHESHQARHDRARDLERRQGRDARVPEVKAPDMRSPEMHRSDD